MHHYIFLLDTSYSMYSHISKITLRINQYIEKIREQTEEDVIVSIVQFNDDIKYIIKEMELYHLPNIESSHFTLAGTTGLYDAVGILLSWYSNVPDNLHSLFIISDGEDNVSHIYNKDSVDNLCKQAIDSGTWRITHFNTEPPNIDPVNYVKIDMNNLDLILNEMKI